VLAEDDADAQDIRTRTSAQVSAVLDRVTEGHETLVVKREGGKPAAIIMPIEEVRSWRETMYLLQGHNGEVLLESIAEIERGQVIVLDEAELGLLDTGVTPRA
jgi:antitoxin YefM